MKTAKLFQNGKSQAVRLPREFRFEGREVYIRKMGKGVMLIPIEDSWESLIASLDHFSEDYMNQREQPPLDKRDDPFD